MKKLVSKTNAMMRVKEIENIYEKDVKKYNGTKLLKYLIKLDMEISGYEFITEGAFIVFRKDNKFYTLNIKENNFGYRIDDISTQKAISLIDIYYNRNISYNQEKDFIIEEI